MGLFLGASCKAMRTVDALVDLKEEGIKDPVIRKLPIVCVTSLFAFLFGGSFGLEISEGALEEYWEHARTCFPWGASHPGQGYIPCALYGDSARYTSGQGLVEKLLCILISFPLFAPASTRSSRFLVFSIRESLMVSVQQTIWPVLKRICDQLNYLFSRGLQVKDRLLKFTCTELRGDWEWHCNLLNLKPRWGSNWICFKCPASRVDPRMVFTDFDDAAGWRGNEFSHVEFLLKCLKPGPICNLMQLQSVPVFSVT